MKNNSNFVAYVLLLMLGIIFSPLMAGSKTCEDAISWRQQGRRGIITLKFPRQIKNGWKGTVIFNGEVRYFRSKHLTNIECEDDVCSFENQKYNSEIDQNQELYIAFRTRLRKMPSKSDIVALIFEGTDICQDNNVPDGDPSLLQVYQSMSPPMEESDWHIHDPSKIVEIDGYLMIACTGKAQEDGYNCGLETWYLKPGVDEDWRPGQCLLQNKPDWVSTEVPDQDGAYWAPSLLDSKTMYYSMSNDNADCEDCKATCIGRLTASGTAPNLKWTDMGREISCTIEPEENGYPSSIDPSTYIDDKDGRYYLIFGGGSIWITELDPRTGLQIDDDWWEEDSDNYFRLANGPGPEDDRGWIEASYLHKHQNEYFLFVNWYDCCMGVDSTYEIHVGKSKTGPLGPYFDKFGQNMLDGQGTLLLGSEGKYIGPGHASIFESDEKDWFSFHYYDSEEDGIPWVETRELVWENSENEIWPRVTNNKFNP